VRIKNNCSKGRLRFRRKWEDEKKKEERGGDKSDRGGELNVWLRDKISVRAFLRRSSNFHALRPVWLGFHRLRIFQSLLQPWSHSSLSLQAAKKKRKEKKKGITLFLNTFFFGIFFVTYLSIFDPILFNYPRILFLFFIFFNFTPLFLSPFLQEAVLFLPQASNLERSAPPFTTARGTYHLPGIHSHPVWCLMDVPGPLKLSAAMELSRQNLIDV
jgi:hypothetical protein